MTSSQRKHRGTFLPRNAESEPLNGAPEQWGHAGAWAERIGGYMIGPIFLLLAAFMLFGPDLQELPQREPVEVSRAQVTSDPLRPAPLEVPIVIRGGYKLRCMECHRLFHSPAESQLPLLQHRDIKLDHGINDECFNCHDRALRDRLVLPGGERVGFTDASRLCGTCHGTAYRDWQRGVHGRTTGSWQTWNPAHRRLGCTECHDPHAPAFGPMDVLPGPRTLRAHPLEQTLHEVEHHEPTSDNPLQMWRHLAPADVARQEDH